MNEAVRYAGRSYLRYQWQRLEPGSTNQVEARFWYAPDQQKVTRQLPVIANTVNGVTSAYFLCTRRTGHQDHWS